MARTVVDRPNYSDLAPCIRLKVEGTDINEDITKYVIDCKVDMTRDIADQIQITVVNPLVDSVTAGEAFTPGQFMFIDNTMFQTGNRIEVELGYGLEFVHVAGAIIQRWMPNFPSEGMATLTLKALDHSSLLMDGETCTDGASWTEVPHDGIVTEVLKKYNINSFVGDSPGVTEPITIKKAGMSDYQFVKGLANLHGYYFKVRWDPDADEAVAYWGEAATVFPQEVEYTFTYGAGDESTLISFEPQFALRGAPSGVKVTYWDSDTKTWELVPVEEDDETGKLEYDGDGAPSTTTPEEITSSTAFRITTGGKSIQVVPERPFQSPEAAQAWAEKWMREHKDNFITGRGRVVGLETLRPGQIHTIEGVGLQLSGSYEFTTVTHAFDSGGYYCEFFAHKVVT